MYEWKNINKKLTKTANYEILYTSSLVRPGSSLGGGHTMKNAILLAGVFSFLGSLQFHRIQKNFLINYLIDQHNGAAFVRRGWAINVYTTARNACYMPGQSC